MEYFSAIRRNVINQRGEIIDQLDRLIIDGHTGKINSVRCTHRTYNSMQICYERGGFLVTNHSTQKPRNENFKNSVDIIGLAVRTESGKYLGKVTDFAFEEVSFSLVQILCVKSFLFLIKKRLIPRTLIVTITHKNVLVKDDYIAEKNKIKSPVIDISPA